MPLHEEKSPPPAHGGQAEGDRYRRKSRSPVRKGRGRGMTTESGRTENQGGGKGWRRKVAATKEKADPSLPRPNAARNGLIGDPGSLGMTWLGVHFGRRARGSNRKRTLKCTLQNAGPASSRQAEVGATQDQKQTPARCRIGRLGSNESDEKLYEGLRRSFSAVEDDTSGNCKRPGAT